MKRLQLTRNTLPKYYCIIFSLIGIYTVCQCIKRTTAWWWWRVLYTCIMLNLFYKTTYTTVIPHWYCVVLLWSTCALYSNMYSYFYIDLTSKLFHAFGILYNINKKKKINLQWWWLYIYMELLFFLAISIYIGRSHQLVYGHDRRLTAE